MTTDDMIRRITELEDELHLAHTAICDEIEQGPCPGGCNRQTQGARYCLTCLMRHPARNLRADDIINELLEDIEVREGHGGHFSLLYAHERDDVRAAWAKIIQEFCDQ